MKKFIFILLTATFLMGCSDDAPKGDAESKNDNEPKKSESVEKEAKDEIESDADSDVDEDAVKENTLTLIPIEEFITNYNNLASLTDELEPLTDSEPRDGNAQFLLDEDTYGILAVYNEDDDIINYSVGLTRDGPYEDLVGNGLYASMHVASALGIDFEQFANEFESALEKESHIFFDSGHVVTFENHKMSGESGLGMMIIFMKFLSED